MCPLSRPNLALAAGPTLLARLQEQLSSWDLTRVDADVGTLLRHLAPAQLRRHYLTRLIQEGAGAIAELFALARASTSATAVEPHPAGQGRKRYDAKVAVAGVEFALEVKHQRDDFPFRDASYEVPGAGRIHSGLRPGADPKYTGETAPRGATRQVPGSAIWRDALLDAADQLPHDLSGIIAVSVDAFGGFETDIIDALVGDHHMAVRQLKDGSIETQDAHFDNGAFDLESFAHVTAVWFFKLHPEPVGSGDEDLASLCVWARGCGNYGATRKLIPSELQVSLPNVYEKVVPDDKVKKLMSMPGPLAPNPR